MRLVDAGEVELDAAVSEYLPGFRAQDSEALTVAHLLTHTSGFSTEAGLDAHHDPRLTIADRVAGANDALRSSTEVAPFAYSNLNYAVLGAIIETVSDDTFETYMERELFGPVGMHASSADPAVAQQVAAGGHRVAFGVPVTYREETPAGAGPDGYMTSTAPDFAAFMRMLLRGGLADGHGGCRGP